MAKARTAKPKSASKRGSLLWLQGLICGAVLMVAAPIAVLGGLLMAPSVVVMFLDDDQGRPVARSVVLAGAAVALHPLLNLWAMGHRMDTALALGADPATLAPAWVAQGLVWVFCELAPLIITLGLEAAAQANAARLRLLRARLEEEWGIPPP